MKIKERIKNFYNDHKKAIWIGGSIAATAIAAVVINKKNPELIKGILSSKPEESTPSPLPSSTPEVGETVAPRVTSDDPGVHTKNLFPNRRNRFYNGLNGNPVNRD